MSACVCLPQTDVRDQACALAVWLCIMVAFLAFGTYVIYVPTEERKAPAQTTVYMEKTAGIAEFTTFPNLVGEGGERESEGGGGGLR